MKTLEQLTKKELIELIIEIRPKAMAYDRICEILGIEKNILHYINDLKAELADKKANEKPVEMSMDDKIDQELIEIPIPIGDFVMEHGNGVMFTDGMYYHFAEVIKLLRAYVS